MLKTHIGACNKVEEYSAQFSIGAVSLGATNCLLSVMKCYFLARVELLQKRSHEILSITGATMIV